MPATTNILTPTATPAPGTVATPTGAADLFAALLAGGLPSETQMPGTVTLQPAESHPDGLMPEADAESTDTDGDAAQLLPLLDQQMLMQAQVIPAPMVAVAADGEACPPSSETSPVAAAPPKDAPVSRRPAPPKQTGTPSEDLPGIEPGQPAKRTSAAASEKVVAEPVVVPDPVASTPDRAVQPTVAASPMVQPVATSKEQGVTEPAAPRLASQPLNQAGAVTREIHAPVFRPDPVSARAPLAAVASDASTGAVAEPLVPAAPTASSPQEPVAQPRPTAQVAAATTMIAPPHTPILAAATKVSAPVAQLAVEVAAPKAEAVSPPATWKRAPVAKPLGSPSQSTIPTAVPLSAARPTIDPVVVDKVTVGDDAAAYRPGPVSPEVGAKKAIDPVRPSIAPADMIVPSVSDTVPAEVPTAAQPAAETPDVQPRTVSGPPADPKVATGKPVGGPAPVLTATKQPAATDAEPPAAMPAQAPAIATRLAEQPLRRSPAARARIALQEPVARAVAKPIAPAASEQVVPLQTAALPADLTAAAPLQPTLATARLDTPAAAPAQPSLTAALADKVLDLSRDTQWIDQLARDIASAGDRDGTMRFRLAPEQLGALKVEISQSEQGAHVRLHTATEAAQQALTAAQPKLVEEARAQGVRIADTQVSFTGGGDAQAQQQNESARQRAQAQPVAPLRTGRAADTSTISAAAASQGRRSDRYA